MSALSCDISGLLIKLAQVYELVLIAYALLSWVPDLRGSWTRYIDAIVNPVIVPLRRIIPPLGGLDLSVLVALLAVQFLVIPLLEKLALNTCYFGS